MKNQKFLSMSAMLLIVFALMTGCTKDEDPTLSSGITPSDGQLKGKPQGGLKAIDLKSAANFVILTKSGITDVPASAVTGNVGVSPASGTYLLLTCSEVTGTIYTVDPAGPSCHVEAASLLTTAVADMETAYTDGAGRINPDFLNLGAGNIGGLTLTKGLYKWASAVNIATNIKIKGGSSDVFIFQVDGTLNLSSGVNVTLTGGAKAKNIFWVVAGAVTLGTDSHFEGNILAATNIAMQTTGSINGRLLAQTAATLQQNTVVKP